MNRLRSKYKDQGDRPFVFYTGIPDEIGGSKVAEAFAAQIDGMFVDSVYPEEYICEGEGSWWINFCDPASGVFAEHAHANTEVYVVLTAQSRLDIRYESTFWRMEVPTLMDRGVRDTTVVQARDWESRVRYQMLFVVNGDELAVSAPDPNFVYIKPDIVLKPDGPASPSAQSVSVQSAIWKTETVTRRKAPQQRDESAWPYTLNWEGYGDNLHGNCKVKKADIPCAPGRCGMHTTQSMNEVASSSGVGPTRKPQWSLDIKIKDANREEIGSMEVSATAENWLTIPSKLPYAIDVGVGLHGYMDTDPLELRYAHWTGLTQAPDCSVGKYSGGNRDIDCGFECPVA
ncbi:hypothetical protein LTR95_002281 [Oleoguttula sp. CCFEE 5521]